MSQQLTQISSVIIWQRGQQKEKCDKTQDSGMESCLEGGGIYWETDYGREKAERMKYWTWGKLNWAWKVSKQF